MTTKARKAQNENATVGDVAENDTPVEPDEQPAVTPEGEPMQTRTVRKYVDPADDPSGGITGVPVDYIPAPAVP